MKCPGCGYVSFDLLENCKRCGAPLAGTTPARPARPSGGQDALPPRDGQDAGLQELRLEPDQPRSGRPARGRTDRRRRPPRQPAGQDPGPVEMLDDDALEVSEADLAPLPDHGARDVGMPFHIDEDLFGDQDVPAFPPAPLTGEDQGEPGGPFAAEPAGPAFVLADEEPAVGAGGEPVIDRDDEIPERFWAPEIAGLGRRSAALLVDQSLLALVLGAFFAAAFLALRFSGFDTDLFVAADGLRAAALPFALLALLASLAYQTFFQWYAGRTPGKALAGIEIRTGDGAVPSWGRLLLRWSCALLGLAAAGVGLAWALFEPRHRGWADLLSGTVVARWRAEADGEGRRR